MKKNIILEYFKTLTQLRILVITLVVFILLYILSPVFREPSNIIENILRPSSNIAILALGMTFILASKGIDLSVGSIAALASCLGIIAFYSFDLPIPVGILIGLGIGALAGLFNALFITKINVAPFIVTIATMSIFRGLTLVFAGDLFSYGLPNSFRDIGRGSIWGIPIPFIILVVLWIFSLYLFNQTRVGRYSCAIGSNEQAARVAGISVDKYKVVIYTFIGILSAISGLMFSARANMVAVTTGLGYELDAIAAVILGGTTLAGGYGSITGSVIGAILLTMLSNGLQLLGINTFIQRVVVGVIIIVGLAYAAWHNEQEKKAARLRMVKTIEAL
jgi:ribose/xylose/arabinose/galactoside ABC-type transport system permease subunit